MLVPLNNALDTNFHFQAEHGPDSQVVLVISGDGVDLRAIEEEISKQCESLPRGEIASKALSHSYTVYARDMVEVSPFIVNGHFHARIRAFHCVLVLWYGTCLLITCKNSFKGLKT